MPTRQHETFTRLAGIPVHYARLPVAPYGTRGKAPGRGWRADPRFLSLLETAFADLWMACPYGKAETIVSAGFLVDKPGMHGKGRAMDLDSIWWQGRAWVALDYPSDPRFYLAIEAVLRRHFGSVRQSGGRTLSAEWVLDWHFNPAHHDHIHIDDDGLPGLTRTSRSDVSFVQAALTHALGLPTPVTGRYDDQLRRSLHRADAGDLRKRKDWMAFLARVVSRGFAVGPPDA